MPLPRTTQQALKTELSSVATYFPSSHSIVLFKGCKRNVVVGERCDVYIPLIPSCILLQKYSLLEVSSFNYEGGGQPAPHGS
jgi:hypothetical protein